MKVQNISKAKRATLILERLLKQNQLERSERLINYLESKKILSVSDLDRARLFLFFLQKKYLNAYFIGRRFLSSAAACHTSLNLMGLISIELDNTQQAVEYFKLAIRCSVSDPILGNRNKLDNFEKKKCGNGDLKRSINSRNLEAFENLITLLIKINNENEIESILSDVPQQSSFKSKDLPYWECLSRIRADLPLAEKNITGLQPIIKRIYRLLVKIGDYYLKKNDSVAIKYFQEAANLDVGDYRANFGLGLIALKNKQSECARNHFEIALQAAPTNPKTMINLGIALYDLQRVSDALYLFCKAVEFDNTLEQAYLNIGNILFDYEQYQDAESFYLKTLALNRWSINGYNCLGKCFAKQQKYKEAIKAFQTSLNLDDSQDDIVWNKSLSELSTGNFLSGWKGYESRLLRPQYQSAHIELQKPFFPSSDIKHLKSVLVLSEQGYGDIIQMARFVYQLSKHFSEIFFMVPPPLKPLFRTTERVKIIDILPNSALFDGYIFSSSLPHFLQTTSEEIPGYEEIFNVERGAVHSIFTEKTFSETNIGICWFGNSKYAADFHRSIDSEAMKTLWSVNVRWHSLQVTYKDDESRAELRRLNIIDYADQLRNFKDTAQLIDRLDMVISVDTAVAHLSGALGKLTFLLLPKICDYRWALSESTTPWYKSIHIFRQKVQGEWGPVIEEVAQLLTRKLKATDT